MSTTTAPAAANQLDLDLAAFERTATARHALPIEQTPRYTLEASYAVSKALQTAARLVPFRSELARLPHFSLAHLDGYEDLARALRHTNGEIGGRVQWLKETPALAEEGYKIRQMMMAYLEILAFKGIVPPALITQLREGSGYRDLADDLNVIGTRFRSLPAGTMTASPVTADEIARGMQVAHEILTRMGVAELDPEHDTLLAARQKIGALLVRSQAQLRRAMAYLRFDEGDAAELVPTLFLPAGRPSRAGGESPVERLASALHDEMHAHGDLGAPVAPVDPQDNPFEA